MGYLFTSESVTSGHPDKLCDLIADSILDECISLDKNARVAVEVFVKGLPSKPNGKFKSFIIIGGEITINSKYVVDYEKIARQCAIDIGYIDSEIGMDARTKETCEVILLISQQSDEISRGVSVLGAGDQGIIFGYATNESERFLKTKNSFMPLPILLANKITTEITNQRLFGKIKWARPDGKSQITVKYDDNDVPQNIDTVVIAIQHDDMVGNRFDSEVEEQEFIKNEIREIIFKVIPEELINDEMKLIVNGTGRFCIGGPNADAGLTGRKIIVDTYGGSGRHGGGAFSGKDPTKVDRSAAYAARYAAKHIVASGIVNQCEIQLSYSIGSPEPVSVYVKLNSKYDEGKRDRITNLIKDNFDFRPNEIIKNLGLKSPIYAATTSGGHFGRDIDSRVFPWEKLDEEILNRLREY